MKERELKIRKLINEIIDLNLDYRFGLNRGGCAYFALIAYDLFKHYGYDDIVMNWTYIELGGKDEYGVEYYHCSHAWVCVEGIHFDSDGINNHNYYYGCETIDRERAYDSTFSLGDFRGRWNSFFDRTKLPEIYGMIEAVFRKTFDGEKTDIQGRVTYPY